MEKHIEACRRLVKAYADAAPPSACPSCGVQVSPTTDPEELAHAAIYAMGTRLGLTDGGAAAMYWEGPRWDALLSAITEWIEYEYEAGEWSPDGGLGLRWARTDGAGGTVAPTTIEGT